MKIVLSSLILFSSFSVFANDVAGYLTKNDIVEITQDFTSFFEGRAFMGFNDNGEREYKASYAFVSSEVESNSGKTSCSIQPLRSSEIIKEDLLDGFHRSVAPLERRPLYAGDSLKVLDLDYIYDTQNVLAIFDLPTSENKNRILLQDENQHWFYVECNGDGVRPGNFIRRNVKGRSSNWNIIKKINKR